MEIWHNPRCSKSRAAKQALDGAGREYTERSYLDQPPPAVELDAVLDRLGKQPWEITRMNEPVARELGMATWEHDRERWIAALVAHPVLIQRPIVLTDDGRAVLARTPEEVEEALG
ncbi:arsenate reductase [Streptoalloteichus tenebrarius]|uniref:Arsenate reductase n=1 Tax=Streptoalloteichus tenebrarius (strain ATCC 17920 / DSM 40477 / JCM 4838 / CBS 697.72 / NBRC 16177 / NCIMB 11028 / NRRL B-12390 / A12253. 1 / ISP 5477) TaxID=1933 RepID=A0ABT1HVP0_STRSD|nr:arsenate reductase family protein [Streptoalloteichus tenebrarius]MCP2259593.1 arsenate reductase [Streptoalloteichus tenebrarius]BFF01000.1 arsenate reductase family protein [Streptoalloteichus tenebrarius]